MITIRKITKSQGAGFNSYEILKTKVGTIMSDYPNHILTELEGGYRSVLSINGLDLKMYIGHDKKKRKDDFIYSIKLFGKGTAVTEEGIIVGESTGSDIVKVNRVQGRLFGQDSDTLLSYGKNVLYCFEGLDFENIIDGSEVLNLVVNSIYISDDYRTACPKCKQGVVESVTENSMGTNSFRCNLCDYGEFSMFPKLTPCPKCEETGSVYICEPKENQTVAVCSVCDFTQHSESYKHRSDIYIRGDYR